MKAQINKQRVFVRMKIPKNASTPSRRAPFNIFSFQRSLEQEKNENISSRDSF